MNEAITTNLEPSERRLTANVTFHAVAEENEPLGQSVAYRIDARGFWEERSAGSGGEDPVPATLEEVAQTLTQHFESVELLSVLSHLAALRDRIRF